MSVAGSLTGSGCGSVSDPSGWLFSCVETSGPLTTSSSGGEKSNGMRIRLATGCSPLRAGSKRHCPYRASRGGVEVRSGRDGDVDFADRAVGEHGDEEFDARLAALRKSGSRIGGFDLFDDGRRGDLAVAVLGLAGRGSPRLSRFAGTASFESLQGRPVRGRSVRGRSVPEPLLCRRRLRKHTRLRRRTADEGGELLRRAGLGCGRGDGRVARASMIELASEDLFRFGGPRALHPRG